MNAKAKGTRLELKTRRILEKAGYQVTRSSASLGVFDLVAIGAKAVRLIQVKANRNASPAEREAMELVTVPDNCSKEIWIWKDYARDPEIRYLKWS